jgi:predicted nucleic acid-binding protein
VNTCVVDASVAVKWFLPEIHWEAAWRLRNSQTALHVPAFFELEFSNVLCKKVRRGELSRQDANLMLEQLGRVTINRHPDTRLLRAALDLAHPLRQSLYDCLYLVLALQLKTQLVTADQRFRQALLNTALASHLLWIEDLP